MVELKIVEILKDNGFYEIGDLISLVYNIIIEAINIVPYIVGSIVLFVLFFLWIEEKTEKKKKKKKRVKKEAQKIAIKRAS